MRDISNKADIKVFVDAFYDKVRVDPLLGPVFHAKIADGHWPAHLERMYGFWNTVLFAAREYRGNPFAKHANLPIQEAHFNRWIALLTATIEASFAGEKAEEVKMRAHKMGQLFQSKLAYLRENNSFNNLL